MRSKIVLALACACVASCAALDKVVSVIDPTTGEVTESSIGDLAADAVESVGSTVSGLAGDALGLATANPIIGAGGGAALLALFGAGASHLRRRRKQGKQGEG
jgi:hypothetical protein